MLRKYHKLRKQCYYVFIELSSKIWYKYLELNLWVKISIFWTILVLISLFLPWIESLDWITPLNSGNFSENAFSIYTWFIWYFLLILLIFMLFTLISEKRKERLKYFSLLDLPESILVFFTTSILTIISIQYFFMIGWLQTFNQNIIHGSWLILATTWTIILYVWYIFMKKIRKKGNSAILWYENHETHFERKENNPNNMKLPF